MLFSNNHETPLMQVPAARPIGRRRVEIDITKTVRYVSMQISGSDNFQGIRLYDEYM